MDRRRAAVALITLSLVGSLGTQPVYPQELSTSVRVFAIQYQLDPTHVERYDSFYLKMKALIDEVKPQFAGDQPNLVVFGEDTGLATLATGPRFGTTRDLQTGGPLPSSPWSKTEPEGIPAGAGAAFASLAPGYSVPMAYYRALHPGTSPARAVLLAATDSMVRSFYNAFARLAVEYSFEQRQRYGGRSCNCEVFIVASNNMAPFEDVGFSQDPSSLLLVDPDVLVNGDPVLRHGPITDPIVPVSFAYRATAPEVYNTTFVWGPQGEIGRTYKVNLTPLEGPALLDLSHGDLDRVQPITIPGSNVRIGIATSLDSFAYRPADADACRTQEVPLTNSPLANRIVAPGYMRCLDSRGVDVMVQPEANPKRWASYSGSGAWEPLTFMGSDYRAVSDPSVNFRYAVSSFVVGNLIDIVFDGQSGIWERGRTGPGLARVGALQTLEGEPATNYAGLKPEAVVLAPWVAADSPDTYTTGRADLLDIGARLAPGSGDPLENQYVETVLCADLDLSPSGTASVCPGSG